MIESARSARIVLTTAASPEEADRIGRTLVEERLAACATLIPAVQSIYEWKGNLETSSEAMLLLKTDSEQVSALEARLRQLHRYETPEFLVLGVESGSRDYLAWMFGGLGPAKNPES